LAHPRTIAHPPEIAKHGWAEPCAIQAKLEPRHPERIPALSRVRTLAPDGLRSAEVPHALRRKRTHRAAARERHRARETPQTVRRREVQRPAAVRRVAVCRWQRAPTPSRGFLRTLSW